MGGGGSCSVSVSVSVSPPSLCEEVSLVSSVCSVSASERMSTSSKEEWTGGRGGSGSCASCAVPVMGEGQQRACQVAGTDSGNTHKTTLEGARAGNKGVFLYINYCRRG